MPSDPHLSTLLQYDTPRVWSLLVTMFGDLTTDVQDRIDGPVLSRLTDALDLKPEAVRVALHRLRNDDWITSQKLGRTASHALSKRGWKETQKVYPLVYSAPSDLPRSWQLALTKDNSSEEKAAMTAAGFTPLAPRLYVSDADKSAPGNALVLDGTAAPGWLQAQCCPAELGADFAALESIVHEVAAALDGKDLTALSIAATRCLVVHNWRRLVLRHPYLPPALTGEDWPGHRCRVQVISLLRRLPRPCLKELETV